MARIVVVGELLEDLVIELDGYLLRGTDCLVSNWWKQRGGSAAHTAAALAVETDHEVTLVSAVGTDAVGDSLLHNLRRVGVHLLVNRRGATGQVFVVIDASGEKHMLTYKPVESPSLLGEHTELPVADVAYVSGYELLDQTTAQQCEQVVRAAGPEAQRVVTYASSGSAARIGAEVFRERIQRLKPHVAVAGADELRLLGPLPAPATTIVTDGAAPTQVLWGEQIVLEVAVPYVEGYIDAAGAGDAFTAGVLHGLARSAGLAGVVDSGHAFAAQAVRCHGPWPEATLPPPGRGPR